MGLIKKSLFVRCAETSVHIAERLVCMISPIFVVLAVSLLSLVIIVHFTVIIPFYSDYVTITGLIHLAISGFLSQGIMLNYAAAVLTNPGYPPFPKDVKDLPRKYKVCKKCNRIRPPRAHHCGAINTCVLKMDHYCPWVANCVGHHNHKPFVLFLMYLWMGTFYAACMVFIPFKMSTSFSQPWPLPISRSIVMFDFIISAAVFVALAVLFAWQIYLVFTNQTSIEVAINHESVSVYNNPYDLGYARNFREFMGTEKGSFWFSWLLPAIIGGTTTEGDGTSYPTNNNGGNRV
mmetsp:Transcript_18321/g.20366  ORF Transcript_18321/g.20366 Transcript_18321/m.20366 type:complete len:291 (+) Transcript_18321:79-951(+)